MTFPALDATFTGLGTFCLDDLTMLPPFVFRLTFLPSMMASDFLHSVMSSPKVFFPSYTLFPTIGSIVLSPENPFVSVLARMFPRPVRADFPLGSSRIDQGGCPASESARSGSLRYSSPSNCRVFLFPLTPD